MCQRSGNRAKNQKGPATVGRWAFDQNLVGVKGFEPSTLWSQTRCATRLRYTPKLRILAGRVLTGLFTCRPTHLLTRLQSSRSGVANGGQGVTCVAHIGVQLEVQKRRATGGQRALQRGAELFGT